MPILNSGIGKGDTEPLSGDTVVDMASRASSRWLEVVMDVGSETRRYLVVLDMVRVSWIREEWTDWLRGDMSVAALTGRAWGCVGMEWKVKVEGELGVCICRGGQRVAIPGVGAAAGGGGPAGGLDSVALPYYYRLRTRDNSRQCLQI